MKKRLYLFTIFSFVLLVSAFSKVQKNLPKNDIVVLFTNDVHCGLTDNIGYAGLALYKQEMKEKTPYVSLVDAGDAIQGSPIGLISNGGYIIDIMNQLGYDVAVPGNHEFDYGMERFMQLSKSLKCGYVAANFKNTSKKNIFPSYKIISYGKTKVAYVGVATPESITKSTPAYFKDSAGKLIYSFGGDNGGKELFDDVQKAIDDSRKKGADYVILVAHLGENGVKPDWNAMNLVSHISGADALIDGHSHEVTQCLMVSDKNGNQVPVTQSGTKLKYIGKLTISTDGSISTELIDAVPQKNGISYDQKVYDSIKSIENDFAKTLEQKLGKTDFILRVMDDNGKWLVRSGETNLADLVADGLRDAYNSDVAFVNAGGVRANIKAGDITRNDVFTVQPFGNKTGLVEISGQTILDELEFGVRNLPKMSGGLLQVSGLSYKVNTNIPTSVKTDEKGFFSGVEGEYRVHDVKVGGEPLDLNKKYTAASILYVITMNGDGHKFADAKLLSDAGFKNDRDVLAAYIEKLGGEIPEKYRNPEGEGRILLEK